ncbi:MAG: cyclic nucleotide-binding domain-containing protein [Chloroflexi bacterium]|nr:cyclic nucleotide-binding domain-containing protein [Chloroflexota bacterium]
MNPLHSPATSQAPRVVILGGGYGGIYAALGLQKQAKRGHIALSLISRDNYFQFQPMLAEVLSGSIEPPHVVNPIRRLCKHLDFHQAEIIGVDTKNRCVSVRYPGQTSDHTISYDHLLVAVGSGSDLTMLPGMSEHAFAFRSIGDAFRLRNHIIGILEEAEVEENPLRKQALMTFVIAGGGYTGIEVAAEINSFVKEAAKSYRKVRPSDVKVIVLQAMDRILPELTPDLAAFSHRILEHRGIDIRLKTLLKGATAERAILADGTAILTRTLVAAIGSSTNPVVRTLSGEHDKKGRLVTDELLRVRGLENVWAVGDCASIPDLVTGGACPPTAQYALRESRHVAKNIKAVVSGRQPKPFRFKILGVFVPLGRFTGAAQVFNLRLSGFVAWFLYRTYYLYQLPRVERKLRVLIDWNLELFFRRDIVKQEVHASDAVARAHYEEGETIFSEGEIANRFYIILKGKIQISRLRNSHREEIATLGPGEFFGEVSLLRGGMRTATVRAVTPVDLLTMDGTDFRAIASTSKQFNEMIEETIRRRAQMPPQQHR